MKRIILFTVGSVQEFIISSRKTRDLKNASNILSELIKEAMEKVVSGYSGEIVLPVIEKDKLQQKAMCPNYFVASYENEDPIGEELKELLLNEMLNGDIISIIENYTFLDGRMKKILKMQIKNQLKTALDIYWCDIPCEENKDYKHHIDKLYDHMEAIKNSKPFEPFQEPEGEKCSLCGTRNVIFYKADAPNKMQKFYRYKKDNNISGPSIYEIIKKIQEKDTGYVYDERDFKIKICGIEANKTADLKTVLNDKECLCSVCLKKRIKNMDRKGAEEEQNNDKIRSLAGFALKDWLDKLDAETKESIFEEKSSDKDKFQAVYDIEIDENVRKKYGNPPIHYCLYRMDIDDLGKRMRKEEEPREISSKVYQFLQELMDKAAKEHKNVTIVYAGGDDLLALMSVEESFNFARTLGDVFKNVIIEKGKYADLTYSQGLFFAHHKTPFSEVIRLSRDKLEKLKERFKELFPPKDGTVISFLTDGLSDQDIFLRNRGTLDIEKIDEIRDYFYSTSSYFHQTLARSFWGLEEAADLDTYTFTQMFFIEQQRLMKRSFKKKKEDLSELEETERLFKDFLFTNCTTGKIDLLNYFNLFSIIRKLNVQRGGKSIAIQRNEAAQNNTD